ncbi:MAG TPA: hypothetical protein V6D20_05820 [Candidatus Obscuribacterales bacterium]
MNNGKEKVVVSEPQSIGRSPQAAIAQVIIRLEEMDMSFQAIAAKTAHTARNAHKHNDCIGILLYSVQYFESHSH